MYSEKMMCCCVIGTSTCLSSDIKR